MSQIAEGLRRFVCKNKKWKPNGCKEKGSNRAEGGFWRVLHIQLLKLLRQVGKAESLEESNLIKV